MKENLFEMYARMCGSFKFCLSGCPIYSITRITSDSLDRVSCQKFLVEHTKKAEEIVTKWAEEHPKKTRQDVFLEQYPNAQLNMKGTLMINPCRLDKSMVTDKCFKNKDCFTCSKEYWEEEV